MMLISLHLAIHHCMAHPAPRKAKVWHVLVSQVDHHYPFPFDLHFHVGHEGFVQWEFNSHAQVARVPCVHLHVCPNLLTRGVLQNSLSS
jgi:hypothetical protein